MGLTWRIIIFCFLAVYIAYLPRLIKRHDLKTLKIITLEIVLQNFMCILSSAYLSSKVTQTIILYKELVFYGSVLLYFVCFQYKVHKPLISVLRMLFLFVPYFFIGNASIYVRLISFRQLMTPFILVLYGSTFSVDNNIIKDYLRFIIKLGVFQAIFGFIEEFILKDHFWQILQIQNYMETKGFAQWTFANGLPGNFYSADFYAYIGRTLRRMVGIVADPLLTAHFLAFCIVILLYYNLYDNKTRKIMIIFLSTAVLFTMSKGAFLIIGIALLYKIWIKNKMYAIMLAIAPTALILYMVQNNSLQTLSAHVGGLTSSLLIQNSLGHGLGTAGNLAQIFGGSSNTSGESYIGALIGQMGFIGFGFFIYSFISIGRYLIIKKKTVYIYAIYAYVIGTLIEALISESAINFVGSGVGFLCLGLLIKVRQMETRYE